MRAYRYQDLSRFERPRGIRERPAWFVQLWWLIEALLVRPSPQACYGWRRLVLRVFGAKIGRRALVRPGVRVTFPWKLTIGDYCWIGDNVVLDTISAITIGDHAVISQGAYLCTGTHDHHDVKFPVRAFPIVIGPECWVAARALVGPGVTIARGAVVGACSVVLKDIAEGTIVAGVPAKPVGHRGDAKNAGG